MSIGVSRLKTMSAMCAVVEPMRIVCCCVMDVMTVTTHFASFHHCHQYLEVIGDVPNVLLRLELRSQNVLAE